MQFTFCFPAFHLREGGRGGEEERERGVADFCKRYSQFHMLVDDFINSSVSGMHLALGAKLHQVHEAGKYVFAHFTN